MVTVLCSLVMSFQVYADTLRLPEKMPQLLQQPEAQQHDVMPNAKPSFRSNMPIHKPDESEAIPMPNSGSKQRYRQLPLEKSAPPDSSKQKE